MASSMFSPAKMLPYRRNVNDTGRKRIETTSRQPAAKKTKIIIHFMTPVFSPLGPNNSFRKTQWADFLKRPVNPQGEEHQGHRKRHVDVRVGATEQRLINLETVRGLVSPADRAYTWNEPDSVG